MKYFSYSCNLYSKKKNAKLNQFKIQILNRLKTTNASSITKSNKKDLKSEVYYRLKNYLQKLKKKTLRKTNTKNQLKITKAKQHYHQHHQKQQPSKISNTNKPATPTAQQHFQTLYSKGTVDFFVEGFNLKQNKQIALPDWEKLCCIRVCVCACHQQTHLNISSH